MVADDEQRPADGREIDGGDFPAVLCQPDDVCALSASDVERRPRTEFGCLDDQVRVGFPVPQFRA